MEAAAQRPMLQQRATVPTTSLPGIDVVRALHQTVISLRTALDTSREELRRLKERQRRQEPSDDACGESGGLGEAVERLALENHVLRSRLLGRSGEFSSDAATSPPPNPLDHQPRPKAKMEEAEVTAAGEEKSVDSRSEEEEQQAPPPGESKLVAGQGASNDSENESEELDDIELIFTTEETCRDVGLQEDLVSFTDSDNWQPQRTPTPSEAHKSILKSTSSQSTSLDVANGSSGCNGGSGDVRSSEKTGSVEEAAGSSQSSSIDREESVDRFDESSSSRLNKMWSQCSVLVETDISKCGVLEELDLGARHAARRNTLAAPPAAYRPIIHREALAAGRRKSSVPLRPVMDSRSGGGVAGGGRKESGAQTDISALPAQWRSESYLAHKVAHAFTTLPSKFALPAAVPSRLRLSDKTREARRVMLSDISFTSMVPELSRSADHLCHDPQFPQGHCYTSRAGGGGGGGGPGPGGLRTPESSRRESWLGRGLGPGPGLPSPCDCRLSTELYSGRYRGSLSSIPSPGALAGAPGPGPDGCLLLATGPSRRHSWRPNAAASFDGWRAPAVLPHAAAGCSHLARPTWSSMPSSPTHVQPPPAALVARLAASPARTTRSKVTFQECPLIRGSLPNLRSESLAENSGDSTESLIDEAEDYLRRSIDSMLTISVDRSGGRPSARRRRTRRHSEPDLFREWNPPHDARPYLPKMPRDLKLDHLVKVISPEGRILQGRVRYVGPVAGRDEVHVGVELPTESGSSDGSFHGRRYFDCEPERAVFVPFKKVVLAWCTT